MHISKLLVAFSMLLALLWSVPNSGEFQLPVSSRDAGRICGADDPELIEVCTLSASNYWCEKSSGGTPCPADCGACTVCSNGGAFQIKRCTKVTVASTCNRLSTPVYRDCGFLRQGNCGGLGSGCILDSWVGCINLGPPSPTTCATALVQESCGF